jgi:hypothetical protein
MNADNMLYHPDFRAFERQNDGTGIRDVQEKQGK